MSLAALLLTVCLRLHLTRAILKSILELSHYHSALNGGVAPHLGHSEDDITVAEE